MEDDKENNREEKLPKEKVEYIEEEGEKSLNFENKIRKLKEKLNILQKEKNEYLVGWQNERADFINYKKEEEERIKRKELQTKGELLLELIKIFDNFERASLNLPSSLQKTSPELKWVEGVLKIKDQLKDFLKSQGVEEVNAGKGDKFNPQFCEAMEVTDGEDGEIIEVLEKGYFLEKKLLRSAKVKVGKQSENPKYET